MAAQGGERRRCDRCQMPVTQQQKSSHGGIVDASAKRRGCTAATARNRRLACAVLRPAASAPWPQTGGRITERRGSGTERQRPGRTNCTRPARARAAVRAAMSSICLQTAARDVVLEGYWYPDEGLTTTPVDGSTPKQERLESVDAAAQTSAGSVCSKPEQGRGFEKRSRVRCQPLARDAVQSAMGHGGPVVVASPPSRAGPAATRPCCSSCQPAVSLSSVAASFCFLLPPCSPIVAASCPHVCNPRRGADTHLTSVARRTAVLFHVETRARKSPLRESLRRSPPPLAEPKGSPFPHSRHRPPPCPPPPLALAPAAPAVLPPAVTRCAVFVHAC